MNEKIKYYAEESMSDSIQNLTDSSIDECICSWRKSNIGIQFPHKIIIYGYCENDKDNYVPNGNEILNDIYDNLYENGYVDDCSCCYSDEMNECANNLSELIKLNIPSSYKAVKKYSVVVNENSFEIIKEGDM